MHQASQPLLRFSALLGGSQGEQPRPALDQSMLLVEVPFASRIWALPILTALTPSKTWCEQHHRHYRTVTDWARPLLLTMRRWLPDRPLIAVMDGEFAA